MNITSSVLMGRLNATSSSKELRAAERATLNAMPRVGTRDAWRRAWRAARMGVDQRTMTAHAAIKARGCPAWAAIVHWVQEQGLATHSVEEPTLIWAARVLIARDSDIPSPR